MSNEKYSTGRGTLRRKNAREAMAMENAENATDASAPSKCEAFPPIRAIGRSTSRAAFDKDRSGRLRWRLRHRLLRRSLLYRNAPITYRGGAILNLAMADARVCLNDAAPCILTRRVPRGPGRSRWVTLFIGQNTYIDWPPSRILQTSGPRACLQPP